MERNRALTTNRITKAKTKRPKRLTKTFSALKTSQRVINPAKKTKNGFLSKSFMVR